MSMSLRRALSFALSLICLVAFSVTEVSAQASGCRSVPPLTPNRMVENRNLGSGASAQAWQWYPNNNDAANAGLSPLGTKVSIATANLRNTSFGIVHKNIPITQDLRALSYSAPKAFASINGDYFDQAGPWNAMIESSQLTYATPGLSGVVGMVSAPVKSSTGYRVAGSMRIGSKSFRVTGVNQLSPGNESVVVYKSNFVHPNTPQGDLTLVIRSGKLFRVYSHGSPAPKSAGLIVQIHGSQALAMSRLVLKSKVSFALGGIPTNETRLAADSVSSEASISNRSTTMSIDAVNFTQTVSTGATLFTDLFNDVTTAGRVTIRVLPDNAGRLVVANVYKQGYYTKVDPGGYILQANGASASAALKFKVGDVVTISNSYAAQFHSNFITAAGRGPRLVENSKMIWVCGIHNQDFRPRSAIGWNQDGQVWLMSSSRGVDADDMGMRQGGSTPDQIGHWLISLGATDAVLLDGGGSTTMEIKDQDLGWHRFDIPDSAWYRPLANAFVLNAKN